jgi:hypothetical protein
MADADDIAIVTDAVELDVDDETAVTEPVESVLRGGLFKSSVACMRVELSVPDIGATVEPGIAAVRAYSLYTDRVPASYQE